MTEPRKPGRPVDDNQYADHLCPRCKREMHERYRAVNPKKRTGPKVKKGLESVLSEYREAL